MQARRVPLERKVFHSLEHPGSSAFPNDREGIRRSKPRGSSGTAQSPWFSMAR